MFKIRERLFDKKTNLSFEKDDKLYILFYTTIDIWFGDFLGTFVFGLLSFMFNDIFGIAIIAFGLLNFCYKYFSFRELCIDNLGKLIYSIKIGRFVIYKQQFDAKDDFLIKIEFNNDSYGGGDFIDENRFKFYLVNNNRIIYTFKVIELLQPYYYENMSIELLEKYNTEMIFIDFDKQLW